MHARYISARDEQQITVDRTMTRRMAGRVDPAYLDRGEMLEAAGAEHAGAGLDGDTGRA